MSSNKSSKTWWSTVKWLLGKGNDTSYPTRNGNNANISENKQNSEAFNEFLLSHSNIDNSGAELPDEEDAEFPRNLEFISATEQEVHDLLKCINTSKASGPDGVSPTLIHETGLAIDPSLTKLINVSFSKCNVPNDWKLANVIPLFKKGEKNYENNFHPVSLLSCLTKKTSTVNRLTYIYHIFAEALDHKKIFKLRFVTSLKLSIGFGHKGLIYKLKKKWDFVADY